MKLFLILLLGFSLNEGIASDLNMTLVQKVSTQQESPIFQIQYAENAIKHFLAVRPDAADTAEGIHYWWIQWPTTTSPMVTLMALENLQEEGFVESMNVGTQILWRRAR